MDTSAMAILNSVEQFVRSPIPGANQILQTNNAADLRRLLDHFSGEEVRLLLPTWERWQVLVGLLAAAAVYYASEKRLWPQLLCALMLVIVLIQYFAVTPELIFRGRAADFPRDPLSQVAAESFRSLAWLYVGGEILKLITACSLASWLFSFRSRKRRHKDEDAEIARAAALRSPGVMPKA